MTVTKATTQTDPAPTLNAFQMFRQRWSAVLRYGVPLTIGIAFFAPLFIQSRLTMQVLALAYINAAVVAGLVLSLGYTGLLNLSQGTFYGLGAYTTAILVADHGLSFLLAALCGMVAAGCAGMMLALASVRVKGDYFVLVSLALTIAIAQLIANLPDLTRGREGFFGLPQMSILGLRFDNALHTYYVCLLLLALTYLLVDRISKSFLGRAMMVVRYDDIAARSMGISPFQVRALALVIGSMIAALAGSVLVGTLQFIRPDDFDFNSSFMFSLYVIIGGMASLPGAVLVAMGFTALNEQFTTISDYRVGLIGLIVIAVVFWRGSVIKDAGASLLRKRRGAGGSNA
jgi:branched-chain amino acid transport system permease protein